MRGIRLREQEGEITPKPREQATRTTRHARQSPNAGRRKCCVEGCRRMRAASRSRCRDCDYELRVERARRDEQQARVRRDSGRLMMSLAEMESSVTIGQPMIRIEGHADRLLEEIRLNRNGIMTRLRRALGLEG